MENFSHDNIMRKSVDSHTRDNHNKNSSKLIEIDAYCNDFIQQFIFTLSGQNESQSHKKLVQY